MLRHGKPSLNRKLALTVVAALVAAFVVIATATLWQETRRHTQGKLEYLEATAAAFASAASRAAAEGDERAVLFTLRGIARAPSLLYARAETTDGRVLAQIGSSVSLASDVRYGEGDTASFIEALQSQSIQVTTPIMNGGVEVGAITLVADNSDLLPRLVGTLLQTLLGAMIALTVGLVIASRLQRWVVRPLLALTETVRAISQTNDYTARVDIDSNDEVGELCGGFNAMLGAIQDRERRITDLAFHDSETDLPNRLAFERDIAAYLAASPGRSLAVAVIGVDRLQYVRGVIGYQLASDLLGELGARGAELSVRGVVGRIATDMIAVLIEAPDEAAVRTEATAILAKTEAPMRLGLNDIDVNLTMGVAMFGVHADAPPVLVERACIALDQARAAHAKLAIFDQDAYVQTAGNLTLMADMERALHNGEMTLYLQPKYDLRRGKVTGAEALARWRHPKRGMIPPDVFVCMAEETGAIGPLTFWALRHALDYQDRLLQAGIDITLAVNISGRLLSDAEFIDGALPLVEQAKGRLCLEITETASIGDQDLALRHIEQLVAAGAKISIDDYGAGLSSLAYLKRIPAHELKIDKMFVLALGEQRCDALLVKSTIDLAHSLGMQVTAEGVETEAALAALTAMGCDHAQGYYIGRPIPEAEFTERFANSTAHIAPPLAKAAR